MVFRNLRERFGIDDQDYQVGTELSWHSRGIQRCGGQEATRWAGVRVSAVPGLLHLPVQAHA
jgi:hypothetical protein